MSMQYLTLLIVEGVIFFISLYIGAILRFSNFDLTMTEIGPLWPRAIIISVVLICSMTAMGMYDRNSRHSLSYTVLCTAIAFSLGFMLVSLIFFILPELIIGRGLLLISIIVSFIAVIIGRIAFNKYLNLKQINQRILVVGAGRKAVMLEKLLRRKADRRGIEIVGYVSISDRRLIHKSKEIRIGTSLKDFVMQNNIDEIVLAIEDRRNVLPLDDIVDCRLSGVVVSDIVSFIERRACKVLVSDLEPSWLMYSDGFKRSEINDIVKRVFDVVISCLLLIVLFPVLLLAISLMYLDDRWNGGVFYSQKRVGFNNEVYHIYKLRSMVADSESNGKPYWASENDERITRVGRILRRFRIDEIPQLLNVIKGDMSFVGPRPERPEFVNELKNNIPYFTERHRVKPGITGWAQICYPYGASIKDSQAKLEYDLYYVKNYSLFLDLIILFQTVQVVLFGKGAR